MPPSRHRNLHQIDYRGIMGEMESKARPPIASGSFSLSGISDRYRLATVPRFALHRMLKIPYVGGNRVQTNQLSTVKAGELLIVIVPRHGPGGPSYFQSEKHVEFGFALRFPI